MTAALVFETTGVLILSSEPSDIYRRINTPARRPLDYQKTPVDPGVMSTVLLACLLTNKTHLLVRL